MTTNVNPKTGIRYGLISANSLDSETVSNLQMSGTDLHYEEAKSDLWADIKRVCKDYMSDRDSDDVADQAIERMRDHFEQDEPVHEFDVECPGYGRVKGQTTWLGGALLLWIFESPFQTKANLCSPCVPGAGNLDSLNPDGYDCYDVPNDWRYTS